MLLAFLPWLGCANEPTETANASSSGAAGGDETPGPTPEDVANAAAKYPDLAALWENALYVSCGPNNGVCHQNKQFPHMEFATSLIDAIDAPCNQLRDDPTTIANLCEPEGDLLELGSFSTRIGSVTGSPADEPTAIVMTLQDEVPAGVDTSSMAVVRQRPGLSDATIPIPSAAWVSSNGRTVTFDYAVLADKYNAPGPAVDGSLAEFFLPQLYIPAGDELQVEQGDPNGDGVFGHELGGAIIKPGQPMDSYLLMRVLGPVDFGQNETTSMTAPATKEPQMPIANAQYWDADHAVVALWCWISALAADGSNAEEPIDYEGCDVESIPPIVKQGGEASTYSSFYEDVLLPRCSSCHKAGSEDTTLWFDDPQLTYSTLLGIVGTGPSETSEMPYITKNDPEKSFLFLKIRGDASAGTRMPLDGEPLPESTIAAIQKWIEQGANDN